jgi:transposase
MKRGVLTEQRTNIKFLVKLCKSRQEILEMLETVYGNCLKRRTVYKWVDRFKEVPESVDDNMQEGRPSTSCVGVNIQCVHDWWCQTVALSLE